MFQQSERSRRYPIIQLQSLQGSPDRMLVLLMKAGRQLFRTDAALSVQGQHVPHIGE